MPNVLLKNKNMRIFSKVVVMLLIIAVLAGSFPVLAAEIKDLPVLSANNLALGAKVQVSSVYENQDAYSGSKAIDGDLSHNSRWAAANKENCYILIELRRVAVINRVKLYEDIVHGERMVSHLIEYWDGEAWQTAAQGNTQNTVYTDAEKFKFRQFDTVFDPVTTSKIRISMNDCTDAPAIRELEFLNETGTDVLAEGISVNGKPLDGFSPTRFQYDVVVSKGSSIPSVTSQGGTVTNAGSVPGSAVVLVKSGKLENIYTINFTEDDGYMINEIIDAHKFSDKSGAVQDVLAPDGSSVGNFEKDGYIRYNGVDFGAGEAKVLMAVASATVSGQLEIRIDGTEGQLIGTLGVNATGSAYNFAEQYANIAKVTGVHDLFILSKSELPVQLDTLVLSSYGGTETAEEKDTRMSAFREARYGQFIHLGAYANFPFDKKFEGYSEWIMYNWNISRTEYEKLAVSSFNPAQFSAKKIVKDAADAGVKYMVFTSKHHEGYSMYNTKVKGFKDFSLFGYGLYNGEDPVLELSKECKDAGIIFGCYYSIMDWRHWTQSALGGSIHDKAAYISDMKAQLKELIEVYDVDILWFDGEWNDWWTTADGDALYRYLRTLKPSIIVNNRVGKRAATDGDFGTPEQEIPAGGLDYDWESCITMNNSWGYLAQDTNWKSVNWIISSLAETASKGGNMLLNVGPDNSGVVPKECTDRLKIAGEWLKSYGESIYDTAASPFSSALPFGCATKKEGKLYLHVTSWPENGKLLVPSIKNKINSVSVLGQSGDLSYVSGEGFILIELPGEQVNEYDSVIVLDVDGTPEESEHSYLSDNLAKGKPAAATNVYFNDAQYDASKAVDGNASTRWATDDNVRSAALEINLGKDTVFNMVVVNECITWGRRVGKFTVEYWDGSSWKAAASAEGMGANKTLYFEPVTSSKIRINILGLLEGVTNGPSICEVQVYNIDETANSIMKGDVDFDGKVTVSDVVKLRSLIMSGKATEAERKAGDLDNDGTLTVSDVVALRSDIIKGK